MRQSWRWGLMAMVGWMVAGWGEPAPAIEKIDSPARARAVQEAWARHLGLPIDRVGAAGMRFRLIPPGRFAMGSGEPDAPVHWVTITRPFYLGATEVTQAQYREIAGKQHSDYDAGPERPVNYVTWYHVQDFIAALKKLEPDASYRLPTEAEWEYAARAGAATDFPGGNTANDLARAGWFIQNSGGTTREVATKTPNPFGLYDLHGNVWEWCSDYYEAAWYEHSPGVNPQGPERSLYGYRVMRGGAASYDAAAARSGNRAFYQSSRSERTIGFRLVLAIPANEEK